MMPADAHSGFRWWLPKGVEPHKYTEAIAHGCTLLGMNSIKSVRAAEEYAIRAYVSLKIGYTALEGITWNQIHLSIGLATTAPMRSRQAFLAQMSQGLYADGMLALIKAQKNPGQSIEYYATFDHALVPGVR